MQSYSNVIEFPSADRPDYRPHCVAWRYLRSAITVMVEGLGEDADERSAGVEIGNSTVLALSGDANLRCSCLMEASMSSASESYSSKVPSRLKPRQPAFFADVVACLRGCLCFQGNRRRGLRRLGCFCREHSRLGRGFRDQLVGLGLIGKGAACSRLCWHMRDHGSRRRLALSGAISMVLV